MTNTDGSLFDCGTFYVREDTEALHSMQTLMNSCISQLNAKYPYQEARNIYIYRYITWWHQEAIAWTVGKAGDVVTWTANDYARDLVFEMRSWIMNVSVDINADKRGG